MGIIGLVEKEWVTSISCIHIDDVYYEPFIESGRRLANELREQDVYIISKHFLIY